MAKSQLEIVLIDGGETATAATSEATSSTASATATRTSPFRAAPTGESASESASDDALARANSRIDDIFARVLGETAAQGARASTAVPEATATAAASAARVATPVAAEGAGATATAGATTALATLTAAALNPITITAAVVAAEFIALGVAAKQLHDIFSSQIELLKDISPDIAQATSETDIRRLRTQVDRAERIGPELARFERLRGRGEDALARVGTSILDVLIRIFEFWETELNVLVSSMEATAAGIDSMSTKGELIFDFLTGRFGELPEDIKRAIAAETRFNKELLEVFTGEKPDKLATFLDDFLNAGADIKGGRLEDALRGRRR